VLGQSGAPAVWKVGPSRRHDHQRRLQIAGDALQEVEQWLLGPVQILEHDQQRLVTPERSEEVDPRLLQALPGRQGVEIPCNVYAKRETEDRPRSEPFEHRNGRVTLQEAKR